MFVYTLTLVLMEILRVVLKWAAGKTEFYKGNENLAWRYSMGSVREGVLNDKCKREIIVFLISRVDNALSLGF